MKRGKHNKEKVKVIDKYLVWVIIAILALGIAYAQIADQELTVSGNVESEVQEGVFISGITYKSNNGADITNSVINYYLGTMMDSKIVLGSSSISTISYNVTVYNNTDKEQLFIKTLTDDTDEILYSNTNIGYSVSIEDYVTTIAPRQSLTFTITFAYNGTNTSNPILNSKLNFRFKEKPVIELSNVGQTYTLENIGAGHVEEYEFTVKNNNTSYTNGVPMTYEFATTLTEGSPLTAEIYDASGNLMSGEIELKGEGTTETHTYKLKLTWDSSLDSTEYEGKEYACNVTLKAKPTEAKYLDYEIEKKFNVDITTCNHKNEAHNYVNGTCTLCGQSQYTYPTVLAGKRATENAIYSDGTDTAVIPEGFTVSGLSTENKIADGLVIYLIPEGTTVDWTNGTAVANAQKTYDQFVWIPMAQENINEMYMCQSEDGTKSCKITVNSSGEAYCTTHSSTAMAGRLYATSTENNFTPTLTTQKYTANSGLREPDVVTTYDGNTTYLAQLNGILGTNYSTASAFKTDLQTEYNNIVKSVYQNEGFYVGRYEASEMVNSNTNVTIKVVAGTKNGISNVSWYRAYAQLKRYAENNNINTVVSSTMIQGAANDQIMKFVNEAKDGNGNDYIVATYSSARHSGSLGTTGSDPDDKVKNIYDLEGNVCVWNTEAHNTDYRVLRGGYYTSGSTASASYRQIGPSYNYNDIAGALCQLYLQGKVESVLTENTECSAYKNGVCTICGKNNIIPISTVDQLLQIGTGNQVTIGNKTYTFTADEYYQLQNDLTISIEDYKEKYPNAFKGGIITIESETTNYAAANSTSNPYYTYTAPETWQYTLEVWGASGGQANSDTGGAIGGYSIGTVTLNQGDTIYVYVGEKGGYQTTSTSVLVTNGYNGGGGSSKSGRNWWWCK